MLLLHEQQQVPMRRAVMMRLGNAETVDADALAVELGADLRPDFLQVVRAISRRAAVEFRVIPSVGGQFLVEAARAGQRNHAAEMPVNPADFVKTAHARHQFHAADGGIGQRFRPKLGQAERLARFFTDGLHLPEKFDRLRFSLLESLQCLVRDIQTGAAMHHTAFAHDRLKSAVDEFIKLPRPPVFIFQTAYDAVDALRHERGAALCIGAGDGAQLRLEHFARPYALVFRRLHHRLPTDAQHLFLPEFRGSGFGAGFHGFRACRQIQAAGQIDAAH